MAFTNSPLWKVVHVFCLLLCLFRLFFSLSRVKTCFYSDYSEDVRNFCLCLAAEWKRIDDSLSGQQAQQAWIQSLASFIFSYFHTNTLSSFYLSLSSWNQSQPREFTLSPRSKPKTCLKKQKKKTWRPLRFAPASIHLHNFAPKSHLFAPIQDVFNHLQTLHSWNLRGT